MIYSRPADLWCPGRTEATDSAGWHKSPRPWPSDHGRGRRRRRCWRGMSSRLSGQSWGYLVAHTGAFTRYFWGSLAACIRWSCWCRERRRILFWFGGPSPYLGAIAFLNQIWNPSTHACSILVDFLCMRPDRISFARNPPIGWADWWNFITKPTWRGRQLENFRPFPKRSGGSYCRFGLKALWIGSSSWIEPTAAFQTAALHI